MDLAVEVQDTHFRIITQVFSLRWPDTPANRKVAVVVLRSLTDGAGQPLFTLQQLAQVVGSPNRQAASEHVELFRACGEDLQALILRKRKVETSVVEAVWTELRQAPLVPTEELCRRVNGRLARTDLAAANIEAALEQLSCAALRRVVRQQFAQGAVHYQEASLLEELLRTCAGEDGRSPGIALPVAAEPHLVDPTAIRTLLTPGAALEEVPSALRWVGVLLTLYYWGVPLSRLGQWVGVHKTTVWRWLLGLVGALWPTVEGWVVERLRGGIVYVDEKWLKIRRRWYYWFVVVDAATDLPVVTYLSPTRSRWACRWVGVKLRRLGLVIKAVITDGLAGYAALLPEVVHQLCVFHHQQGVTRWCQEHLDGSEPAQQCERQMKRVVQTPDKRTVRRRLAKLAAQAADLGITAWLQQTLEHLPALLPAIGSRVLPRTINGIERFFRTFNRFYKGRCGFHSVRSAQGELLLFVLVYLFTQREKDGTAPLAAIVPEVRQMPFYRLINDPLAVLLGLDQVKLPSHMAMAKEALTDAVAA